LATLICLIVFLQAEWLQNLWINTRSTEAKIIFV